MTAFSIFAFILTFCYIIYFAVMITLDLHAKPADGQNHDEEDFDVSEMTNSGIEAPKFINEDPDIEGGRMTYTDSVSEDGLRVVNPTSPAVMTPETEHTNVDSTPSSELKEKTTSEELNEENEYGMEDIEPEPQYSMYGDDLYAFINEKHKNTRIIKKENVRDHL